MQTYIKIVYCFYCIDRLLHCSYLGRKRLNDVSEPAVKEMTLLVQPGYSYWTLAYMLSKSGARKLIQAKPLSKMMAVDEYLSLMFDQHPRYHKLY